MAVSANRLELLQIADAVAREKAIDRGIVIAAMEDAIQKAARSLAFLEAVRAGAKGANLPAGRLHLWIDFYPPDRRRRDDDGLLASMKAARDGIADALGVDDSRFVSHPWIKDEVRKGGEVVIKITGGPNDN